MTERMDLAQTLQTLFTQEANEAARQTGFVQRSSPLTGARFLQTLVFGWMHDPDASLDELAELAADVTPQALDKRLNHPASQCLVHVLTAALQRVVTAKPVALPLLQRFQGVYVFDTTTLSLPAALAALFPGCGGKPGQGLAALKCPVGVELTTGALDLALGAGRQPDVCSELAQGPLPAGALRLADRGFFDLQVLSDYDRQGVYWISRLPARLSLYDAAGQQRSLADWLAEQKADRVDVSLPVARRRGCPVACWPCVCRPPWWPSGRPVCFARPGRRGEKSADNRIFCVAGTCASPMCRPVSSAWPRSAFCWRALAD